MADLASALTRLVQSVVEMPGHFNDVAAHDPLSAVLLALGTLFVGVSVAVLGYLSVGALFSVLTTDRSPERPPQVR